MTGFTVFWGLVFLLGIICQAIFDIPTETWAKFWHFYMWFALITAIITTTWFTIGGIGNLKVLFSRLKTLVRDHTDDGEIITEQDKS